MVGLRTASDPINVTLLEEETTLMKQHLILLKYEIKYERLFYTQKSKIDWMSFGDTSSRFIHAQMKERRSSQRIATIRDSQGRLLTDESLIKNSILEYYQNLLGTSKPVLGFDPLPSCY